MSTLKDTNGLLRLVLLLALFLIIAMVFNKILVSFNHNEHMYITAAYLVSQGQTLYPAIFVGYEGKLDEPLRHFAWANNYQRVEAKLGKGELYLQPR